MPEPDSPFGELIRNQEMREKLTVIKVGGKIVEEEATLRQLLNDFAAIDGHKVLVHGGGRSLCSDGKRIIGLAESIHEGNAYIKNKKKIRAMDGDLVYGTFWSMEDDYTVEPYIRVAAGDYLDLCDKWGKDSALTAILLTIGHELTHYFQWINALELTPIGMERQATKYARYVLDDYAETREHP